MKNRESLNPQAPVAQKIADEVVFRRFQGEGVEFFFKSNLTDPLRFLCASFGKSHLRHGIKMTLLSFCRIKSNREKTSVFGGLDGIFSAESTTG